MYNYFTSVSIGYNYLVLRGIDKIAETSFEITHQALTYEWSGYGVKLHIPQDSLPANCQQCNMEMIASLSGQYAFPANCEIVSGVYWIYCPVKLRKYATLEVQHCSKNKHGLSFFRAECTQEQLPYLFQRKRGGIFSEHCSYGSIDLSKFKFSGWGIVACFPQQPEPFETPSYSAQVYYVKSMLNTWKVLFAIRRRRDLVLEDLVHTCMG